MGDAIFEYKKLLFTQVTSDHIDQGWLEWLQNPDVVSQLAFDQEQVSAASLEKYLQNRKSDIFLAGHLKSDGTYIGNLRIYQIKPGIHTFGRLIGPQYQGEGYGVIFSEFAQDLIFNHLDGELLLVGNKVTNRASRQSKIRRGFRCVSESMIDTHNLIVGDDEYFYIDFKMYISNQ